MKTEHKEEMKARARNIALKLAYDGTAYHGFQRQSPPVVAVQNVLEQKLAVILATALNLRRLAVRMPVFMPMGRWSTFLPMAAFPLSACRWQ